MSRTKIQRPADDDYYVVPPWSDQILQGDIFMDVPLGFPAPPDAVVLIDGERRFITGPFEAGPAMLISPSCSIAAQGPDAKAGTYAHPARIMVALRPLNDLQEAGLITDSNLGHLRADRLQNYMYLPAGPGWPESVALLYMPITIHHDVVAEDRAAQLTGTAFWHLRMKLMAYFGGYVVYPEQFGPAPEPRARVS